MIEMEFLKERATNNYTSISLIIIGSLNKIVFLAYRISNQ